MKPQANKIPRRFFIFLCFISFFLLFGPFWTGCQKKKEAEPEKAVRPVRYAVLRAQGQEKSRAFSGTAVSAKQSALSFKVAGTMQTIHVKVGDKVSAGTLLAELDTTDLKVDLDAARASLKTAEADAKAAQTNVHTTRSNYTRIEKLYESDNVSLAEFEQARGDYNTANAQLQAANSQIKTQTSRVKAAENQLGYAKLTAPFEGVVNSVNVEENEEITPGEPIIALSGLGNLEVTVNLSDRYISSVSTGMKCSVSFPALRGTSFEGVVTEVPYAASDAPTYPATVSIQSKNEQLRPGMAAEVLFSFGETGESLYLPPDGVGEDSEGNFVFVLEKSGEDTATAKRRKVKVGPLTEKGFALVEGLEEGDYIATSGLQILLDGMEVKLLKEMQENK